MKSSKLPRLPHQVLIDKPCLIARVWCGQQFGAKRDVLENREGRWDVMWDGVDHYGCSKWRFRFASEQDMMLFILRWK